MELYCQPSDVADAWPGFAELTATRQTSLIDRASAMVRDHCRRRRGLLSAPVTEALDGRGRPSLWLARVPVTAVLAVTINGIALDNTMGDAWSFVPRTGELTRGRGQDDRRFAPWWPQGVQNCVVQYWGGYDAVPPPVAEATVLLCHWLSDLSEPGGSGVMLSERIGDYYYMTRGQSLALGVPDHIAALLSHYVLDGAFA